eukprot:359384-Prorocentrum_minimum.AAC.1
MYSSRLGLGSGSRGGGEGGDRALTYAFDNRCAKKKKGILDNVGYPGRVFPQGPFSGLGMVSGRTASGQLRRSLLLRIRSRVQVHGCGAFHGAGAGHLSRSAAPHGGGHAPGGLGRGGGCH